MRPDAGRRGDGADRWLLLTPSFLTHYKDLALGQFTDERARIDAFAAQTAGTLVYQAQGDPWCNTILLPERTAFLPEALAIPAGIGISFYFDNTSRSELKSGYVIVDDESQESLTGAFDLQFASRHDDRRPVPQHPASHVPIERQTMTVSWLTRALTLGVLAITLPLAARGLYGPQGALVNIRWQPSVDAAERQRLESGWQLVDGAEVSASTWSYELTAPSEGRLRAIVEHPAIADTTHHHRPGAIHPRARRTPDRPPATA